MSLHPVSLHSVWQVLDSRFFGGIESHILYLATALQKSGYVTQVVFLQDYGPHPLKDKLRAAHIPFFCCAGIAHFRKTCREQKPDLIHSHGYKASIISRLAALPCPVVTSFHAGDSETWRVRLYSLLDRKLSFLAPAIAVNQQIADGLSGPVEVIENFVPVPDRAHPPTILQNIGFVGRLSHEKGPDRFIALARRFPTRDFYLYGDGPLRDKLAQEATTNVHFMGHQQAMDAVWGGLDLLCMPSRKEGLPLAALEAMSHAIPVLCLDAGALAQLVSDDENGWVVSGQDDEKTVLRRLTQRLAQIEDHQLSLFGQRARAHIEGSFSPQALLPRFLSFYHAALSRQTGHTHTRRKNSA